MDGQVIVRHRHRHRYRHGWCNWRRWTAVAVVVLGLGGCTRIEFLYDHADWFIVRWVDTMLEPDSGQRERWRAWIEDALSVHRRELLVELVGLLQQARQETAHGPTAAGVRCLLQAADQVVEAHAQLVAPVAAAVLTDASAEQLEILRARFDEQTADYRDDFLDPDPARREQRRVERYVDRIERWTGDLATEQLRLVERLVGELPDLAADWLVYRESQQASLLQKLRSGDGNDAVASLLVDWWGRQRGRAPQLVDKAQRIREGIVQLIVVLVPTLDSTQRAHLQAEIDDMRDQLASAAGVESDGALRTVLAHNCFGTTPPSLH